MQSDNAQSPSDAIKRELSQLAEAIDSASIEELRLIIDRCREIGGAFEIRRRALREVGRLMQEAPIGSEPLNFTVKNGLM